MKQASRGVGYSVIHIAVINRCAGAYMTCRDLMRAIMFTAIALDFTARGTMRARAEKVLARMYLCGLYIAI